MWCKPCVLDWRRHFLWWSLIDLNEIGPTDLLRLLSNVLEKVRAGSSQWIFELLNHLISLLLYDFCVPSKWGGLLVLGALLIHDGRRVDVQIVVLGAHQVLVPFKLCIRRGQVTYIWLNSRWWWIGLVFGPVIVTWRCKVATLRPERSCYVLSHWGAHHHWVIVRGRVVVYLRRWLMLVTNSVRWAVPVTFWTQGVSDHLICGQESIFVD